MSEDKVVDPMLREGGDPEVPVDPETPDYSLVETREEELEILRNGDGVYYVYVLSQALQVANILRTGISDDQAKDLAMLRLEYLEGLVDEAKADFKDKITEKYDAVVPRPGAIGGG